MFFHLVKYLLVIRHMILLLFYHANEALCLPDGWNLVQLHRDKGCFELGREQGFSGNGLLHFRERALDEADEYVELLELLRLFLQVEDVLHQPIREFCVEMGFDESLVGVL